MKLDLCQTVPLLFVRIGPQKWAARTPHGELAYGESQGLYEWRHRQRIDYSGGDRPAASHGMPRVVSSSPANCRARRRGMVVAVFDARYGGGSR